MNDASTAALPPFGGGQQGASSLGDVTIKLDGIARQMSVANQQFLEFMSGFPRVFGVFTLDAAATTVVSQPLVQANSRICLTAQNAAAATLMGSAKSLYVSARSEGVSFTMATANGAAAAGTENFSYILFNPV